MSKQKTVLILGASRYYLRCIEAARRDGYKVLAVDRNPSSEGFSAADFSAPCDIVDKEGILALARKFSVDGIVPVNDYGVPTAAYVAGKLGLPGISEEAAFLSTDKAAMRNRWIGKGLPCPRLEIACTKEEITDAVGRIGLPCILKPAHGIGGASRGVVVVRDKAELQNAIIFSQKFYENKEILIESFAEVEAEHSAEVLIWKNTPYVIAISDKIKSPLPYRVDKNVIYPTRIEGARLGQLKKIIIDAVAALDITTGAAHVELGTLSDGFVLFELGARCGGGGTPEPIVPYVTGVQEFVELVRICCGDEPRQLTPMYERGCNYHFIVLEPGRVKTITGLDGILQHPKVLDAEVFAVPGTDVVPVTVGTERSGFIIVGGETADEALSTGYALEEQLVVTYS